MNTRRAYSLVLGLGAAALLLFLYLKAHPSDVESHAEVLARLQRMSRLEARFEEDVLLSRTDLHQAGAEPLTLLGELEEEHRGLMIGKTAIYGGGASPLDTRLCLYGDALARQCGLAQELAPRESALHLGLRALPATIEAFAREAPALERDPRLRATVDDLLCRLMVYDLVSDVAPGVEIEGLLAYLKDLRGQQAGAAFFALGRLIEPIENVLARKSDLEDLLAQMHAMPLAKCGEDVCAAYGEAFDERLHTSDVYRLCSYLFSIVLLGKLFHGMHLLKKSARELSRAKSTLEERVEERTELLSQANRDLEAEIHERKRAEIEARSASDRAEAANRTKSEFLANMSHEIRTPMTSILGFSERLLDTDLAADEKLDAVSTIRRNGEYLLQIINDILDISKIEAGKLEIERIACSPAELVLEVRDAMEVRAAMRGLAFDVEFENEIPSAIVTDPVRLKQVLLNLVGNAIKFTETGSVALAVEFQAAALGANGPRLRFEITDTGIGMTSDQIARLFKPFAQADSSTTRRFGGTGLGLSICKHLVEKMEGEIAVASSPGIGSTFTFHIATGTIEPSSRLAVAKHVFDAGSARRVRGNGGAQRATNVALTHTALEIAKLAQSLAHDALHLDCRILIVEDGEDNQRLVAHLMGRVGARVEHAENGQIAVAAALDAEREGRAFDIILMDMQMPVMDGFAATRALRAAGYARPIVALTANAMATDRARCLAAGCDEFCTKPIDRNKLLATIAHVVGPLKATRTRLDRSASNAKVIDVEMLALVRDFVDDLSNDVASMQAALRVGDLETLAAIAHQLKGTAGSYGFPALTEHAARVERLAQARATAKARQELDRFAAACEIVRSQRP